MPETNAAQFFTISIQRPQNQSRLAQFRNNDLYAATRRRIENNNNNIMIGLV